MIKHVLLSTIATSMLGIHTSMPSPTQVISNISEQLNTAEQQLENDIASIEQLLMSGNANLNSSEVQQKVQNVGQDVTQVQQLVDQNVTQMYHVRRLRKVGTTQSVQLANGVTLSAGDVGVSSQVLNLASNDISQVALPILKENLADAPKNTSVVLFSSRRAYARALQQAGVDTQEIQSIVSGTGGITVGSQVWIPLYALQDDSDLANVLTHELTHAVFNQEGIGDNLPTWLNEGTAWLDGMTAQRQVDPGTADLLTQAYNQDLQQASQNGELLPLTASEEDILSAPYNVEWEDYLAVENLIQTYGQNKFSQFLANAHSGVDQSFSNAFGVSMSNFEKKLDEQMSSMN